MKSLTQIVDSILVQYKERSFVRVTMLSMFNYLQYELMFYSMKDEERIQSIVNMLATYCRANNYTMHDITNLCTIFNLIADTARTTEYRLIASEEHSDKIVVVDETSYTLYITDSVHDICDIARSESIF